MKSSSALAGGLLVVLNTISGVFATPDPANDKAVVPPATYRSPFHDYRGLGEDKLIPWKQANDEVGRIGGWRVYARESREAAPGANSPETAVVPAPAAKPAATSTGQPAAPAYAPAPARTGHEHHK